MAAKNPSVPATPGMMELSKEEKEALLEKKMEEIRRKNAALQKRHQEIEADRKAAEKSGMAVNPKLQTSTAPLSPKKDMKGVGEEGRTEDRRSAWAAGRGKRLKSNQDKPPNKEDSKEARSPGKDGKPPPKDFHPLARDVGPQKILTEEGNSSSAPVRGRRAARGSKPPIPTRNSNSPPPDPGYSFLADRGRQGPVQKDRPRRGRGEAFRHPRNFGGTDFSDVRSRMRAAKERNQGRHMGGLPPHHDLELTLTGRERREYLLWKEEREKVDQARILRQKAASGAWKREWDADKNENFEPPPPCPPSPKHLTPHRRPGRIGSGRFQHAQLAAAADRMVVSLPGALRQGGRGTGRGRGYRDKASSPAPGRLRLRKTSTSSDDRSVEPQHNSLVIKIDNEYAKAAENQEKRVQFRMPNGNRGRGDASQGRGGRRGEQPANRGGGRRAGVGSGRLRPGSSWQPQDQEEYWEDEGAIMPPVADTQPPPPPVNKPKATKAKTKPKATAKPPVAPAAAAAAAAAAVATTNGTSEQKTEVEVKKTEKKAKANQEEEMIMVNEEDLDDDDDDQWLDIDDPQDFYDMRHGDLGEFSDEEDAHNSSAESLERFIQEHTLRIDASTGLAAQTPPDSQNSQTSQGSDKGDQTLNDSKGSGSDRVSPSKMGNLSDSEYEAAPSPSENLGSTETKEPDASDATNAKENVEEKPESETVQQQPQSETPAEKKRESETVEAKPKSETFPQQLQSEMPAEEKLESESIEQKQESETVEPELEAVEQEAEIVQQKPESKAVEQELETVQQRPESEAVKHETATVQEKPESEAVQKLESPTPENKSGSDTVDDKPEVKPNAAVSEKSEEASVNSSNAQEQSSLTTESAESTVQPDVQDLDSSCGSRSEEEKFEDAREGAASSASSETTQSGSPAHKPHEISKEE